MSHFTLKWGILATGGIAETFTKDLLLSPKTRGVDDISHTVVAAASSTSASRAQDFLTRVSAPKDAKAYGSYAELAADPSVDIIYVASPHSHHYQNARLCLEAGKNVLCEKAFTTNAAQAKALVDLARAKGLFLMEAVWTRYFPLSIWIREQIASGRLGGVHRAVADVSPLSAAPEDEFDDKHRMVSPALAGGALLDLGVYALTWVFQTLYTTQDAGSRQKPVVKGSMVTKYRTGVDESASILLAFPREEGGVAHGVATTSMRTSWDPDGKGTAGPATRIYGDKGEIQVWAPLFRPTRARLVLKDGTVEEKNLPVPGPGEGSGWYNGLGEDKNAEGEGHGMFFEADEAAFAIRDGRKEGRYENLEESLTIMEVMDRVRKDNGLEYPKEIESLEYPLKF